MPKLPAKKAKQVNEAESSSFEPLPEGLYVLCLREVDGSKSGRAGPYWQWEFDVCDEGFENRKLWVNTSLSEKADWKMKETFEAFDAPPDTDTDELIGDLVLARVSQRPIESGSREGQIGNNVDELLPYDGRLGDGGGGDPDVEPF